MKHIIFFLFHVSLNLLKCTSDDRIHLRLDRKEAEFIIKHLNDTKANEHGDDNQNGNNASFYYPSNRMFSKNLR